MVVSCEHSIVKTNKFRAQLSTLLRQRANWLRVGDVSTRWRNQSAGRTEGCSQLLFFFICNCQCYATYYYYYYYVFVVFLSMIKSNGSKLFCCFWNVDFAKCQSFYWQQRHSSGQDKVWRHKYVNHISIVLSYVLIQIKILIKFFIFKPTNRINKIWKKL